MSISWINLAATVDGRTPGQKAASRIVSWRELGVPQRQALAQLVERLDAAYDDLPAEIASAYLQVIEKLADE